VEDCLVGRTNELRTGNPSSKIKSLLFRCGGGSTGPFWLSLSFNGASLLTCNAPSPSSLFSEVLRDDSDSMIVWVSLVESIFGDVFLLEEKWGRHDEFHNLYAY